MTAVILYRREIGIVDVDLADAKAYYFVQIADDAALCYRKDAYEKKEPHNAIASLIAQRQVYGAAVIVGLTRLHKEYTNVPRRYVETYEISENEKQEEKA